MMKRESDWVWIVFAAVCWVMILVLCFMGPSQKDIRERVAERDAGIARSIETCEADGGKIVRRGMGYLFASPDEVLCLSPDAEILNREGLVGFSRPER